MFTTDLNEAAHFVFVAGGIGVTPVMSMLRTRADRRDHRPMVLIYGVDTVEDATFGDELAELTGRLVHCGPQLRRAMFTIPDHVPFEPLDRVDGYLPLERHGLIGDGVTCALVAADGEIVWMCLPRFDGEAVFCSLLDRRRGGGFAATPVDVREARQWYVEDTGVLVTEMRTSSGVARVVDALVLRQGADLTDSVAHGRRQLVRHVQVLSGEVNLRVEIEPRGGATVSAMGAGFRVRWRRDPGLDLHLTADRPLDGLRTEFRLRQGERLGLSLRWGEHAADRRRHSADAPAIDEGIDATVEAWRNWAARLQYEGPKRSLVRRSAITLKLLDHAESGALIAAATSSLPETIAGVRNWDYRFAWVRDTAYAVHAFRRVGLTHEAFAFLSWVLDSVERAGRAAVLYDIDGNVPGPEWVDGGLEGYRCSAPVRWGNGAADQVQNDAYGEIIDCAWQWSRATGETFPLDLWERLRPLIDEAAEVWNSPDHGIWEIRADGRLFTYSVAMCEVALHRGAQIARTHGLPCDADRWEKLAAHLVEEILDRAWDDDLGSLTESFGGPGVVDASLLALPLRHVVPANHPKMTATVETVRRLLDAGNGLLYRYDPERSDDGLPGHEGAFLLCTNWLIDNLTLQGRIEESTALFESLCARAGPLGLLPEQVDPTTGAFLGNYPQAFSHVGLIANGVLLARRGGGTTGGVA